MTLCTANKCCYSDIIIICSVRVCHMYTIRLHVSFCTYTYMYTCMYMHIVLCFVMIHCMCMFPFPNNIFVLSLKSQHAVLAEMPLTMHPLQWAEPQSLAFLYILT